MQALFAVAFARRARRIEHETAEELAVGVGEEGGVLNARGGWVACAGDARVVGRPAVVSGMLG
eukprot:2619923-Lingulodinium_polyedra.AAC.1